MMVDFLIIGRTASLMGCSVLFYLGSLFGKSISSGDQDSIDLLGRLLDSRKRGLLLIYCSGRAKKAIIEHFTKNRDIKSIDLINTLSKKFRQKKQLLRELSVFVLVGSSRDATRKFGSIIVASAKLINNSNLLYPPILLGENLTDCSLYAKKISTYFTNGISQSLVDIKISDRFEPGGGNSTHMSYSRHKSLKVDFCFCIVDSDRRNPSAALGDTAKFVAEVDRIAKSALCDYLIIDTYSAENLLPIDEIERQFIKDKSQAQIESFSTTRSLRNCASWSYLPLKKGISGSELKSNDYHSRYWRDELSRAGKMMPCCDDANCKCKLVPKIGDKTLATALSNDAPNWENHLNKETNNGVLVEYAKISREVRSWLCIGMPIRS